MKINIYYGPKIGFDKITPIEDVITLSELVRWSDARRLNTIEDELIGRYNYLVVSTDEYAGVTEAFIEGFLIAINIYSGILGYSEVYLQNPPTRIVNQLEVHSNQFETKTTRYKYRKITKEYLLNIKKGFDENIYGQLSAKMQFLQSTYDLVNKGSHKPKIIMLYGPPGVGKTEMAKFVNRIINGNKKIMRKQFSMFHNDSFYSYIFGDRSNSFAKDLMDRESNIILLDEFDKCNRIFFSAFYQLFDEGIFTDKYYEVDLENAIILCTSNYLSEDEIRKNLGEAIYSRFDAFVYFNVLSNETKARLIDDYYMDELSKYNEMDRKLIEEENIPQKLKAHISFINNAREIRKYLRQMIAIPLIENL